MKKILARTIVLFSVIVLPTAVQAGAIWLNTTKDHLWNTSGNWQANPVNGTDIFNASSPATNVVGGGYPDGTVFFNANFQAQRVAQRSGGQFRMITIASNNVTDARLTLTGSSETFDFALAPNGMLWDGSPNANGKRLSLQINTGLPWAINGGVSLIMSNLDVLGLGGVYKNGAGTLIQSGSNTYSGPTLVHEGILKIGHPKALGFGGYNSGTNVPRTVVSTMGVVGYTVTAGGSGYSSTVTTVAISGGGGGGATATTVTNSSGAITAVNVNFTGTNYFSTPTVTITASGGSGATADAIIGSPAATLDLNGQTDINELFTLFGNGFPGTNGALINSSASPASIAAGAISSLSITAGGAQFSYPPTVSISGGGGSGAAATASYGLTSESISITEPGINYTVAPTVSISSGGGSGATATATISGGQVTAITIVNPGRDYTNAPTIAINGGDGSGAAAVANADNFTVVGTTVTDGGSGYTSQPTIDITGGENGGGATAIANFSAVELGTNSSVGGNGPITINPVISGGGSLTKNGAGVLTLTAANTYGGGTIINGGTLLANNTSGSATGPGAVTINGGTLGGTGTVSGAVTGNTGGSVAAGASAGILTLAGGLNLSGGGSNVWELAALKDDSNGVGGTDFDQVALTGGTLDLSGNSQLVLTFSGAGSAPYSTNAFWQANHTWTIVTLSGSASNPTNLPFSNIANGIYNAGSFSNYVGTGGKIMLTFTTNAPSKPVITSEPQNVTTNAGKPATFTVAATGTDPEDYQWYFQNDSNPIGGATANSYTIAAVQPSDEGNYFVIITNQYGAATSIVATLTVITTPPPVIDPLVGAGTTNVTVNWGTVVGGTYQLQYNTNLNVTNWYLITNLVATGTNIMVIDRPPAGDFQRYYRVIGQ